VDVKSSSIHFTVQRISDLNLTNVVIPFEYELLNVGNAMNLASGVFTAPVDGIYHFDFSGMKDADSPAQIYVSLQVNSVTIGTAYASNLTNHHLALSGISASTRLKAGDEVRLYKTTGILNDNSHYTHFSGWLVEEDLVLV